MATKISFDEVVNAIQNASISTEEADAIIKDIQQRIQEIEEEKEAKKANAADKPKMQLVGIAAADTLAEDGMGWIVKVSEDYELGNLKDDISKVISEFNEKVQNKKQKKNVEIHSLSDAFDVIPNKMWKKAGIKIVTKEAVYFTEREGIRL